MTITYFYVAALNGSLFDVFPFIFIPPLGQPLDFGAVSVAQFLDLFFGIGMDVVQS